MSLLSELYGKWRDILDTWSLYFVERWKGMFVERWKGMFVLALSVRAYHKCGKHVFAYSQCKSKAYMGGVYVILIM